MKHVLSSFFVLQFCIPAFSQTSVLPKTKATIDATILNQWPSVDVPSISNDAKYAFFTIKKPSRSNTLVLRSMITSWKKVFVSAKNADFSADNSHALILCRGDSLYILNLGSDKTDLISSVSSYKLFKQGHDEWICLQQKTSNDLILRNLKSGKQKIYPSVINYMFNKDASVLLLIKKSGSSNNLQTISWINFTENKSIDIWEGNIASSFVFNEPGSQLAFVAGENANKSIWLYKSGEGKAIMVANNQSKGIDNNLVIDGLNYKTSFSKDANRLFISLIEKTDSQRFHGVAVDVWSYSDELLQERQLKNLANISRYTATFDLVNNIATRLEIKDDEAYSILENNSDRSIISVGNASEMTWNVKNRFYSGSTVNGIRKQIDLTSKASISPKGKYIIGGKRDDKSDLYCYDITTEVIKNITTVIPGNIDKDYDDIPLFPNNKYLKTLIWLKDESYVLINDRNDIWMVDPTAKQAPINLTNSYGKNNHIVFKIPELYKDVYKSRTVSIGEKVLLTGFNRTTKEDGLYEIEIGKAENPKLLTKGNYNFEIPNTFYNLKQLEIKGKRTILIRRESATESPNYFLTSNFRDFQPVTSVYPEKDYNWLTGELHTWNGLDGSSLQGILYKPENFDSSKRYPVVVNYYENMSDKLNVYQRPSFVEDNINIPLFVARGYLVFTTDIRFLTCNVGESALSSVASVAKYLSKFPFVDTKHIGIQGHSFGGYETNYIVTHSNLFAAAMSACGISDLVSSYGYVDDGRFFGGYYETGQARIGKMLWEDPESYIDGSPVLSAHTVTTPLLMMANKKDDRNYRQQLEFFLGLRRLGKRSWLLQYDNGSHSVWGKEAEDFTIRILQFFDHYLKDSACPQWMLNGIPAKMKGIDDGLQLIKEKDANDKWITPQEGDLLTEEEKKKSEKLKQVNPISIIIKNAEHMTSKKIEK